MIFSVDGFATGMIFSADAFLKLNALLYDGQTYFTLVHAMNEHLELINLHLASIGLSQRPSLGVMLWDKSFKLVIIKATMTFIWPNWGHNWPPIGLQGW